MQLICPRWLECVKLQTSLECTSCIKDSGKNCQSSAYHLPRTAQAIAGCSISLPPRTLHRDCSSQGLLSVIIDAISNEKFALLSLLDLTAAFDTVDHEILLRRLGNTFGFRGMILQWLGSCCEGRTQSVMLNGHSTVARTVVCVCPRDPCSGHCSSYSIQRTLAK